MSTISEDKESDLCKFSTMVEVVAKNSQTLFVKSHNQLLQDFLKLFDEYHESQDNK